MPYIDAHTHYFPATLVECLSRRSSVPQLTAANGQRYVRYGEDVQYPLLPPMSDLEGKLTEMDAAGIDVSLLSVNIPGVDGFGDDAPAVARAVNDELADVTASRPDRLAWFAVLPMERPESAAEELRRAADRGARGAMIYSNVCGRPLDVDIDRPLFEAAVDLDVPVLLHPTYPLSATSVNDYDLVSILGFLFDTSTAALRLIFGGLFDRHPEFKFIVAHVGGMIPYIVGRIDRQSAAWPGGRGVLDCEPSEHVRRLYADSICLWPPALRLAIDFLGADHVVFGTDHPYWDMSSSALTTAAVELAPDSRAAVEHGTAAQLFGLGARA